MKTLVVCYSYTGNNRKLAKEVSNILKAEIVELHDWLLKLPILPLYFVSGIYTIFRKSTQINYIKKNLDKYGRIIILSPVWFLRLPPAVRSFIAQNRKYANIFSLCLVCSGGVKYAKQINDDFKEMTGIRCSKLLLISRKDFKHCRYYLPLNEFIK